MFSAHVMFPHSQVDAVGRRDQQEIDRVRQAVNEWIRRSGAFDGVVDFDEVLRDPDRPTRLSPAYASDDHLHVNDAGNVAQGNAIPLTLFDGR